MDPSEDEFSFGDLSETPFDLGALLADITLQSTYLAHDVSVEPKYDGFASFRPGTMSSFFIQNDTDFRVTGLQRTRDNSFINDAILAGSLGQASVAGKVTNAVSGTAGVVKITSTAHGLTTGQQIIMDEVEGTYEANGVWTVTVLDANTFSLDGSTFVNAYVQEGRWWLGVPGALSISLAYDGKGNGSYFGTIPATCPFDPVLQYVRFIFCANYNVHWGATQTTVSIRN